MQKLGALLVLTAAGFLGSVALAQQQAPPKAGVPKPPTNQSAAGQPSPYRPVAAVQDIMFTMIDPASKIVFDAVSTEVTAKGVVEKAPANDDEWAVVRNNALIMVEGANLLMLSGRHIASSSPFRKAAGESSDTQGQLPPAEIEVRVAKDRAMWNRLAGRFRDAALVAFRAADRKKPQDVAASGEAIDGACENCHLRYWYPDQTEVLDKADRALRQRK